MNLKNLYLFHPENNTSLSQISIFISTLRFISATVDCLNIVICFHINSFLFNIFVYGYRNIDLCGCFIFFRWQGIIQYTFVCDCVNFDIWRDWNCRCFCKKRYTARTARFSKKSLGSDVGEIKKMSEKFKKVCVDTAKCPRKIEHGDLL